MTGAPNRDVATLADPQPPRAMCACPPCIEPVAAVADDSVKASECSVSPRVRAPDASTSERAGSESESSRFAARADSDTACQPRAPDWSSTSRVCAEADDAIAQSATATATPASVERTENPAHGAVVPAPCRFRQSMRAWLAVSGAHAFIAAR